VLDSFVALVVRMGSATYPFRAFTDIGGLISFGNISIYRRAATYADSILRGTKPGELPLQSPRPPRANEVME
jgi:hypothetical protein